MVHNMIRAWDLENRFPEYTIEETAREDMVSVIIEDGDGILVAHAEKMSLHDAYRALRRDLVDVDDRLFHLTTEQRDSLKQKGNAAKLFAGLMVFNIDVYSLEIFDGFRWKFMATVFSDTE